jgi:hypothetical protein
MGRVVIHGPVDISDARTLAEIWGSFYLSIASLALTLSIARIAMGLFGNMRFGDTRSPWKREPLEKMAT